MGTYISFDKRKAEALVRAKAKQAKRAAIKAEEQVIWDQLVKEDLAVERRKQQKPPKDNGGNRMPDFDALVREYVAYMRAKM